MTIEIVDLPIKKSGFSIDMLVYQRVEWTTKSNLPPVIF
jgi:hypothetical protein